MKRTISKKILPSKSFVVWVAVVFVMAAGLRLYRITQNEFFLYDEGFYLNYNLKILYLIKEHFWVDLSSLGQSLFLFLRAALATGKLVWFLLVDARVFWGGIEQWFFPRIVSAVFGLATVGFLYLFAKTMFRSRAVALLGAAILAVTPSHVFYSRLAIQEAVCGFFFLAGFYFYLVPVKFGGRTFISSLLLSLAFFSNYRLILLPVFVLFCEAYASWLGGHRPDFRKYFWHTLIFLFLVFAIGAIDEAQNTILTFAWIFHQAPAAREAFDFFNLLSYPFYIYRLEGGIFAGAFFAGLFLLFKKEWQKAFPFAFACFYMAVYSFAAEKGARYLCVVLPLMAMGMACLIVYLFEKNKSYGVRIPLAAFSVILGITLCVRAVAVAGFTSDYKTSVDFIKGIDPHAKVASTQPWIQNLFTDRNNVQEAPRTYKVLSKLYAQGLRYLVVDPQVFISFTENRERFDVRLQPYLKFIITYIKPLKVYPHFNRMLMDRFICEHTENLRKSIVFLNAPDRYLLGALRVYDIKTCVEAIQKQFLNRKAYQSDSELLGE